MYMLKLGGFDLMDLFGVKIKKLRIEYNVEVFK